MYTSDIKKASSKASAIYFTLAVICAVFGLIYEFFSHGVYSFFMIFCFLPPLVLGAFPYLAVRLTDRGMPGKIAYNLYNSGVAAITAGFIFAGVLQIYGTTSRLLKYYFIAGAILLLSGVIFWVFLRKNKKSY